MSSYTPGPWAWNKPYLEGEDTIILRCSVLPHKADARLIAAAPDLLEAAKAALEFIDREFIEATVAEQLRAAIARAEGGEA